MNDTEIRKKIDAKAHRFPKSELYYECEGTDDEVGCYIIASYFTDDNLRWYDGRWLCRNCFDWMNRPIRYEGGKVIIPEKREMPPWDSLQTLREYKNAVAY